MHKSDNLNKTNIEFSSDLCIGYVCLTNENKNMVRALIT